jgi:DNA (cytosine-5)-methyltransferase 1
MKHFDLFSGYGGFTLALERAYANNRELLPSQTTENIQGLLSESESGQVRTIGFSEIDKYASAVLKYHWPKIKNWGDIIKIKAEELPDFDLLTFGFPCQTFSIAGKRKGFEDLRGQLIYEVIRILRAKKPKYFIGENVKGLLSHNKGQTLEIILEELCESGYAIDFEVLNAKNFGVPQNRERIFIVGKRLDLLKEGEII